MGHRQIINLSKVNKVDRIKIKTVKTVNNSVYFSINTGINPGVNESSN
jgi:hypothetical protein